MKKIITILSLCLITTAFAENHEYERIELPCHSQDFIGKYEDFERQIRHQRIEIQKLKETIRQQKAHIKTYEDYIKVMEKG